MTIFIEIVRAKDNAPVKKAKVELQLAAQSLLEALTDDTGIATFEQHGLANISVNQQLCQSNLEIEDGETVTVVLDKSGWPKLKGKAKKARVFSLNSNPVLLANQISQRQVILTVHAPHPKLKTSRPPLNLSLVIDCHNTMTNYKIEYITEVIIQLLKSLTKNDHVAIIASKESPQLIATSQQLNPASTEALCQEIENLPLTETSNLSESWLMGIHQLANHRTQDSKNYVLLFTDGLPNAGITAPVELVNKAKELAEQQICTYTFGVGDDANQSLLQDMAEAGQGQFYFIDQVDKIPNYLKSWWRPFEGHFHVGHNTTLELIIPSNVKAVPLEGQHYRNSGQGVQIILGDLFAEQHIITTLLLTLPAYPVGQNICFPVLLRYQATQQNFLPVTIPALPICFTVVDGPSDSPKPPATILHVPTLPTPPPVPPTTPNPILAVLGGGVFFVMAAALLVGLFTLMPIGTLRPETAAGQPVTVQATKAIIVAELPATVAPTSLIETVTPVTTKVDRVILPTNTPTPQPTETATEVPLLTPTATETVIITNTPVPVKPAQPVEGLGIGNLAPDFTVGSHLLERANLYSLRGKVVLLYFWTTWCPHCERDVPDLEALHNQYGPQGVVVLAINENESLETVEKFAWDHNIHFNVWLDQDGWAGQKFGVRAYPTSYFIDQDGIIRDARVGELPKDQAERGLQALLKK